jgi:hypothetical protein
MSLTAGREARLDRDFAGNDDTEVRFMELGLGMIADYAAITADQKLVVAGIFDALIVQQVPALHPSMALALRFRLSPDEAPAHHVTIRLIDPDGAELLPPFETDMQLANLDPVSGGAAQFVLQLNNVRFERLGRHSFDVLIDGEIAGSIELEVARGTQGQQAAPESGPH